MDPFQENLLIITYYFKMYSFGAVASLCFRMCVAVETHILSPKLILPFDTFEVSFTDVCAVVLKLYFCHLLQVISDLLATAGLHQTDQRFSHYLPLSLGVLYCSCLKCRHL